MGHPVGDKRPQRKWDTPGEIDLTKDVLRFTRGSSPNGGRTVKLNENQGLMHIQSYSPTIDVPVIPDKRITRNVECIRLNRPAILGQSSKLGFGDSNDVHGGSGMQKKL